MTSNAELAPTTELNCATIPQANNVIDVLAEGSMSLSEDTPPLAEVAQQTRPRHARWRTTDLELKLRVYSHFVVWMNMKGIVKTKARKNPTMV